jgi:hypothetical protein
LTRAIALVLATSTAAAQDSGWFEVQYAPNTGQGDRFRPFIQGQGQNCDQTSYGSVWDILLLDGQALFCHSTDFGSTFPTQVVADLALDYGTFYVEPLGFLPLQEITSDGFMLYSVPSNPNLGVFGVRPVTLFEIGTGGGGTDPNSDTILRLISEGLFNPGDTGDPAEPGESYVLQIRDTLDFVAERVNEIDSTVSEVSSTLGDILASINDPAFTDPDGILDASIGAADSVSPWISPDLVPEETDTGFGEWEMPTFGNSNGVLEMDVTLSAFTFNHNFELEVDMRPFRSYLDVIHLIIMGFVTWSCMSMVFAEFKRQ